MSTSKGIFNFFYSFLLSKKTKHKSETIIVSIAIISFLLHLIIIGLAHFKLVHLSNSSNLLNNPIAAIYTPFSFILIYEVYLLVYYLPRSTTIYIAKQYEIITLIVIRRVFKDLSKLEFTADWFKVNNDLHFTYDLVATILLFFMIYIFYKLNDQRVLTLKADKDPTAEIAAFIKMKNIVAMLLIPIFLILAVYSLGRWVIDNFFSITQLVGNIKDVNKIFFDDFFTILILIDVLLLLFSFFHTNKFNKVIRNSGFIISTILMKLSFGAEGLLNTILIVVAVLFGVLILLIHNQYEKIIVKDDPIEIA